jgi:hypothetical protein
MSAKLGKIATAKVEGKYCIECDEAFAKTNMIDLEYEDAYMCYDCYDNRIIHCRACYEEVEEDGDFCSQSCIDTYKYDMRDKCE